MAGKCNEFLPSFPMPLCRMFYIVMAICLYGAGDFKILGVPDTLTSIDVDGMGCMPPISLSQRVAVACQFYAI